MTRRALVTTTLAGGLLALAPSVASAADVVPFAPDTSDFLALGAGALTLIASVVLLVIALLLERVSRGSAMGENISFVLLACICLAASVLARWTARFTTDPLATTQAALGADLLITVGITFLSIYFCRVRATLTRFAKSLTQAGKAAAAGSEPGDQANG